MKIIGKEKDYYDTALGFGLDTHSVYVRETKVVEPCEQEHKAGQELGRTESFRLYLDIPTGVIPELPHSFVSRRPSLSFNRAYVAVAGKAYPIYLLDTQRKKDAPGLLIGFASIEKAINHYQRVVVDYCDARRLPIPEDGGVRIENRSKENTIDYRSFKESESRFLNKDFTEWHLNHGAPTLLLLPVHYYERGKTKGMEIIANPPLKSLGMPALLEPFLCFQAIEQFISGVVPGGQMPIVELSDKSKILKKGFDPKHGFRTRPQN